MSLRSGTLLLAIGLALIAAACTESATNDAFLGTTVVVNAVVYTVDEDGRFVEAFAYDDNGVILAVGDEADVREVAGEDARVINAGGNMALPGFQDAHVHVSGRLHR